MAGESPAISPYTVSSNGQSFVTEINLSPDAVITLPTVGSESYNLGADPQSILEPFVTEAILTVGSNTTAAIYTKHQLVILDYEISTSGITISLVPAILSDYQGEPWSTAHQDVFKIEASSEPSSSGMVLTMQYQNQNGPDGQYSSDVVGGTAAQMRIYRWLISTQSWQLIPGNQTVNLTNHTVTVTIPDDLTLAQAYAVGVDTSATNSTTDVRIPWKLFDQDEYIPVTSNINTFDIDKPK
jgi:hypothetical protein